MEKLLPAEIVRQIREVFQQLKHPVQILFFGTQKHCEYCTEIRQLLEEVSELSDLIGLSVYDVEQDADLAKLYRVEGKAPATIIAAREGEQITDFGIRYLGIPSGHEFTTLIQAILLVSARDSGLTPQSREYIQSLTKPLHLEVFVTPTCPYCPRAVVLAYQLAMENPKMVLAEGIEAMEFDELSNRYMISGVPDTVINADAGRVVGAVPESHMLAELMRVLG
ncbi:MAG: glutaredoxin [Anaerolineae bacterium]|nr:MAG: glutaredoxin [Anaerolineae bacterium]